MWGFGGRNTMWDDLSRGERFSCMTHGAHDFASLIVFGSLLVLGMNCAGAPSPVAPRTETAIDAGDAGDADATPEASVAIAPVADASPDVARPTELAAWFKLRTVKCGKGSDPGYGTCYEITLSLHGTVAEDHVVAKNLWAQVDCTGGTAVHCGGPSGTSDISLTCSREGECIVDEYSESDGYCPPPEDCGSRTRLDKFSVPSGTKLVFAKP